MPSNDDSRVEAAAKAMHELNHTDFPQLYGLWEEEVEREREQDVFTYVDHLRRMARAALESADALAAEQPDLTTGEKPHESNEL